MGSRYDGGSCNIVYQEAVVMFPRSERSQQASNLRSRIPRACFYQSPASGSHYNPAIVFRIAWTSYHAAVLIPKPLADLVLYHSRSLPLARVSVDDTRVL